MVTDRLQRSCPELQIETKILKTHGDTLTTPIVDVQAGRKGLFTSEIERALVAGEIDLAVAHSAKKIWPSKLTNETEIVAVLRRGSD